METASAKGIWFIEMSYKIHLEKEYFHFCSAHFVIFDAKKREELHGHNYYVSLDLEGDELVDGKLVDISELKIIIRKICDALDHKLLLPESNPHLSIKKTADMIELNYGKSRFSFPKDDVLILPIDNTTMENLAKYILLEIKQADPKLKKMNSLSLSVRETRGQASSYHELS